MLRSCSNFLSSQRIKSKAANCAFCFTCCGVVSLGSLACVSDLVTLGNTGKYSHTDRGRQLLTLSGLPCSLCVD